ncbi:MAG: glycosyltransferase family 4 protein [Candidatus Latescibacterota bacterium]|jgi:glycosyltransferase involved in cell wall biosynthesis
MNDDPKKLKILISDSVRVWGGAQRFIFELAAGLSRRGHNLTIQTFPRSPLAARARKAGLDVNEVAVRTDAAPWIVLPQALRMKRDPYDVVMTTWDKDLRTTGLAARVASRLGARPALVVHTRECDDPLKNKARYRWFYNRVADRIIVNSRATLNSTLASAPWLDVNRTFILYKGIDLGDYRALDSGPWRERLHPDVYDVVIGYAGQLVPRKRIDAVFRMLAGAEFGGLPWRFAIAGTGPQEDELRAEAERLGIEDRVIFCGFVEDIHRWLVAIDLFVLPSFIEGFGYVLAEAGAAGKPCVAYRASSVPEVVRERKTALLAAEGDDEQFAAHILTLASDPGLRARMGAAARRDVFERHGLDSMVDRMERYLLEQVEAG